MALDHVEVTPTKSSKIQGSDLKIFTEPQRSFAMTDLTQEDLIKIAREIHGQIGIRLWLVTIKLPKDPSHLAALKCKHKKFGKGHCVEIGCANYISACPRHSLVRGDGVCKREKVIAACPLSPYCTDKTGEHHTMLLYAATDGEAKAQAEEGMRKLGYEPHITRIEVVG